MFILHEFDKPTLKGMPSGDAQRTWFPKMIAVLCREWNASMSLTELIALWDKLDAALQTIRRTRGILPDDPLPEVRGVRARPAPQVIRPRHGARLVSL